MSPAADSPSVFEIPTAIRRIAISTPSRPPAVVLMTGICRRWLPPARLPRWSLEIESLRTTQQAEPTRRVAHEPDGAAPLIGSTPLMQRLRQTIERVASSDFTVLIEGESGTGKELVARQIHELSRRREGPFVPINCAALVETLLEAELFGIEERTATGVRGRRGKFEHADGGTLFLDEVSDLSLSAQAKLLRAIQDLAVERVGGNGARRVDIRIVAATNRSLPGLVARGLFRSDLYYRLERRRRCTCRRCASARATCWSSRDIS